MFQLRPRLTLAGLLVVGAVLGGCGADEEGAPEDAARATTTTPTETVTSTIGTTATAPPAPADTLADAREAVDEDDYAQAIVIATALGAAEANVIRRIISNRIARRVRFALSTGNRSRASSLLSQADRYPTTHQLRQARVSYKTAKAQAAQRAQARRDAVEQRKRDAAARRAAREQAERNPAPPPPPASSVPGGTCSEIPQTDFPVPPGDPRDRDGDGIACET